MPHAQMVNNRNEEVASHCRRVAALARRVGGGLPVTERMEEAMATAAEIHENWVPFIVPKLLGAQALAQDCVVQALRILETMAEVNGRNDSGIDSQTALAAEVLEACNAFDETIEFAAYERVSIPDAITAFHSEAGARFRPEVRRALLEVVGAGMGTHAASVNSRLPVMPKAALQVMRTSDETASPAQLQAIAASDPVLCGNLLNAANSARFGLREPVSRVVDAAARLGVPTARKVLMAACFAPLFASKPLQDLWKHSQVVAAAAAEAAQHISFDTDVAWTTGLLHDIGRLVFKTGAMEPRVQVIEWVESGFPLTCAETLTYGRDHASVGADLLRQWNLPAIIVDAVAYHHQPERSESKLASLLFLAEEWSRRDTKDDGAPELSVEMRRLWAERRSGMTLEKFTELEPEAAWLAVA